MGELLSAAFGCEDEIFEDLRKYYYDNRILIFNEEVNDNLIENYVMWILKWNKEDRDSGIPEKNRRPIRIYINSVGGDVIAANFFCDVIENSSTPIIGVVLSMAASAAYYILLSCHERIAFQNSVLLQHDGSISITNSGSKAKDQMHFIDEVDDRTRAFVLQHTNMDEEFYDRTFDQEYYMLASEAKERGCIDKIVGIDCSLDYIM